MRKIFKNTVLISSLTLTSRILGVVRDALIAMCFGVSAQSDAFFIAVRPFDVSRKLFSEGILSISFIPVFSRVLEKQGNAAAAALVFSFFLFFSLIGMLIVPVAIFFAPMMINIIAPGFAGGSYTFALTLVLFKIMLPYFWLVLITALCMGVLNSLGNFGIPAAAPIAFNLVVIVFTLFMANQFDFPIIGLAVGVTLGGVLQLAIQIPAMIRLGMVTLPSFQLVKRFQSWAPQMKKVFKIMLPCMIGAASYQINIMVASFFASVLDPGSVSFLYYADRLVQFPLALFAVSAATVFLPELSRKALTGQLDQVAVLFSNGLKLVLFVTIPAMTGLMALGDQIVTLLFGHGAFDGLAIQQTADCLFFLVMGLWAFTGVRLFVTLHYAVSSIRIPFYSGLLAITVNLVCCFLFVDSLGLRGLVLSVSLSAAAGFAFLVFHVPGPVNIDKSDIIVSACRSLFLSVIMAFLVRQAAFFLVTPAKNPVWFGLGVMGCICLGIVFYLGASVLVSSPEIKLLRKGVENTS